MTSNRHYEVRGKEKYRYSSDGVTRAVKASDRLLPEPAYVAHYQLSKIYYAIENVSY